MGTRVEFGYVVDMQKKSHFILQSSVCWLNFVWFVFLKLKFELFYMILTFKIC